MNLVLVVLARNISSVMASWVEVFRRFTLVFK